MISLLPQSECDRPDHCHFEPPVMTACFIVSYHPCFDSKILEPVASNSPRKKRPCEMGYDKWLTSPFKTNCHPVRCHCSCVSPQKLQRTEASFDSKWDTIPRIGISWVIKSRSPSNCCNKYSGHPGDTSHHHLSRFDIGESKLRMIGLI